MSKAKEFHRFEVNDETVIIIIDGHGQFSAQPSGCEEAIVGETAEEVKKWARAWVKKRDKQKPVLITLVGVKAARSTWNNAAGLEPGSDMIDCELRGINSHTGGLLLTIAGVKHNLSDYSSRWMRRAVGHAVHG